MKIKEILFMLSTVLIFLMIQCGAAFGAVIYVNDDATGANSGISWTDAYTDFQVALTAAVAGDEILVVAGTYRPTIEHGGAGDRFRSFQMKNGVTIYGGFAGSEEYETFDLDHRNLVANEAIFSGDIGISGDSSDNSYHVFYHPAGTDLNQTAVLDGVTITGGNANYWSGDHQSGGGMNNRGSSPTLRNCTFRENSGNYCGGLANGDSSSPNVINCVFLYNQSAVSGGGMNNHMSSPTIVNCRFEGNSVGNVGGGIDNMYSSPTLINCTFWKNSARDYHGGGMYNFDSSPIVTNCIFYKNSAPTGSGIYNRDDRLPAGYPTNPVITNCIIWEDTIVDVTGASPALTFSVVDGGYTGTGNIDTDPQFVNADAGDFHMKFSSPCIDAGNNTALPADITDIDYDGNVSEPIPLDLDNMERILDGNNDGIQTIDMGAYELLFRYYANFESLEIVTENMSVTSGSDFRYNSIYGNSWLLYISGGGFSCGFNTPNSENYNLIVTHLSSALSSCPGGGYSPVTIRLNETDLVSSYDVAENHGGTHGYVADRWDITPDAGANTLTWTAGDLCTHYWIRFIEIRSEVKLTTAATPGGRIVNPGSGTFIFSKGTEVNIVAVPDDGYRFAYWAGDVDMLTTSNNSSARFIASRDSELTANFAPVGIIYVHADASGANSGISWTDAYTDLQDALANAVSGDTIWVASGTYKPTSTTDRSISFQMKNGVAIYGGFVGNEDYAAFDLNNRDFTANETILSGDIGTIEFSSDNTYHVFYHPGGTNLNETAVLDGVTISGGTAYYDGTESDTRGGGMFNDRSSPSLNNCIFSGNFAEEGGGMYNSSSSLVLNNCMFKGNDADFGVGGGMANGLSFPILNNCVFTGNSAGIGGGMINGSSDPVLNNCVFTGNSAGMNGGGMYNSSGSSPRLTNCIVWGDTPNEIYSYDSDSIPVITYSNIQGGYPGTGNINLAPAFVGVGSHPYSLSFDSPCINAGNPETTIDDAGSSDIAGYTRIFGGRIDMGASEFVDFDSDRLSSYEEEDLYLTNPEDFDTDNDGIGDGAELNLWADNWNYDYDGDVLLFINNLHDPDSDGDGFPDGIEIENGTSPSDPDSHPEVPIPVLQKFTIEDADSVLKLSVDGFDGVGGFIHIGTEWRIISSACDGCFDDDCDEILKNYKERVPGSEIPSDIVLNIPIVLFAENAGYTWQARFKVNRFGTEEWSLWACSDIYDYVDSDIHPIIIDEIVDSDGIGIDGDVDLDNNGEPDKIQDEMKIIKTIDDNAEIAVKVDNFYQFKAIRAIRPESIDDTGSRYLPFGLITFSIDLPDDETNEADVEIFFAVPLPDKSRLFCYEAETGTLAVLESAEFNDDMTSVRLRIEDGETGDSDGVKNGSILHTSGAGIIEYTQKNSPDSATGVDVGGVDLGCFIDIATNTQ